VPVEAVLQHSGKDHVAVKKADGGLDWREVMLGLSNGNRVEVKQGIQSGDVVVLNPVAPISPTRLKPPVD